ncbi:MAG: GGDEF domain-containing protein, partial [Gammaproteobacteria bacterium]|nr:GGDEF domain-containing protein [Gammaproteobacteria bacterium]
DATIDVLFFSDEEGETIMESIFSPAAHELYMRSIVLLLFTFTSIITRKLIINQENTNHELEKHKNNLQGMVEKRTEQLEKLATIDDLTQIYNRRKIYEFAGYEVNRSIRYKHPLSVIMIDIDYFKKINDNYGHDVGDKILQQLCDSISEIIRKTDIFGRIGGEEFMLILPETPLTAACDFAERIRTTIEQKDFDIVKNVTISLGVTQCVEEDNILPLFKRADIALYTAKNDGRNRVVST